MQIAVLGLPYSHVRGATCTTVVGVERLPFPFRVTSPGITWPRGRDSQVLVRG